MGLTCYLAMEDPQVEIPDVKNAMDFGGDPCYRWNAGYRDWLWTERYLEQACVEKKRKRVMIPGGAAEYYRMLSGQYLMGITWSVLRAKADTMGNHIIIMTWEAFYTISETKRSSVIWEQENIRKIFGPERYEILCNSSRGHSVPVIEGNISVPEENTGRKASGE